MTSLPETLQAAIAPDYEIDSELAGGGMSRVFLATDRKLGRKVVVKVLPPDLAAGVNRDRFQREIQFAAQLIHPHIVQVLSAGETDELLYYTMPYIEGQSLRTELEKGPLSSKRVVRILHDVVDALAYAHERGIIHRDIKPGNILTLGTHALVTDFGVAKAISAALPSSGVTSAGMAIGTPAYMAPEQLAADPAADHRVDIYAVGLLAYELLTGSSPFNQESPQATMAAQLTRVPEPLDKCCPGVTPELSRLVMRCLEKVPSARPQTAKALLASLDQMAMTSGAGIAAVPPVGNGRNRGVLIGLGAAAVSTLIVAGFVANRSLAERPLASGVSSPKVEAPPVSRPGEGVQPKPVAPIVSPVTKPRALTHADSLAIANAMRGKIAVAPTNSVTTETHSSALVSPPVPTPPRVDPVLPPAANSGSARLIVMAPRVFAGRPDLMSAARAFAGSLRAAAQSSGRYSVIAPEAMRQGGRDPRANALKPDYVITMSWIESEPPTLVVQLHDPATQRALSVRIPAAAKGAPGAALPGLDAGVRETLLRLSELQRK